MLGKATVAGLSALAVIGATIYLAIEQVPISEAWWLLVGAVSTWLWKAIPNGS